MNFVTKGMGFTRVSASGLTCLTSAACVIQGIFVPAVLTGQIFELYQGNTGVTPVIGTCTLASNTYLDLAVSLPTGATYRITNEDVDLTIFWRPVS